MLIFAQKDRLRNREINHITVFALSEDGIINRKNMNLHASLKGRLRNTNLPKSRVLLPLFEAVVNSIHSIDERIDNQYDFSIDRGEIQIEILRSGQTSLIEEKSEITGFVIRDNGIGFTDSNYLSFQTLDSEYKIDQGCRGIGRLLWLKAFNSVQINSSYYEDSIIKCRSFCFNEERDIFDYKEESLSSVDCIQTSVYLRTLKDDYVTSMPKTLKKIASSLLEHCLWYFIREGGAPDVLMMDGDESILINDLFDSYMLNAATIDSFELKGQMFEITHMKLKINSSEKNSILYSASNRLVLSESLKGRIPGLFSSLQDENGDYYYMCYVSSDYLTQNVSPERLSFNIPEKYEPMFAEREISFGEIRDEIIKRITIFLESSLQENRKVGLQRVTDFVDNKAPKYRPIMDRFPEDQIIVDPDISDKDLDLKLHSLLSTVEHELISEGHELMIPQSKEDNEEYIKRLNEYLNKASDLKQSDLANYVSHRKVIIELFANALTQHRDGKYSKEEVIHKLIMPMQKDSNELFDNESNLWLIDERLAFHNYLASDKTLKSMPITGSDSTKEPDIVSLNVYDNPFLLNEGDVVPLASISVIEIKRPMRNDAKPDKEETNPIIQCLGYLDRVRQGKVTTASGRIIPNSQDIPGFCYIICDITETIEKCCKTAGLTVTYDKMGYFGYNSNYKAYIEVISFDRLLNSAKQRNRAFFDKLGLPSN